MSTAIIIELVGYIGSILVLVAFLMTSVVKLRVVNSVGSLIFAIYALIIHSYPTALMNFCLVLINIHFLWHLRNKETNYDLLSVSNDDSFLAYILEHYRKDIEACFPGIDLNLSRVNRAFIVCCDAVPAGVMLGKDSEGILDISLDYSIPMYRDCSIGKYLMEMLPKNGIRTLIYSGPNDNHQEYLRKMGFCKKDGIYIKELA